VDGKRVLLLIAISCFDIVTAEDLHPVAPLQVSKTGTYSTPPEEALNF
jgi:hypothetical protein